jgi:hypothetical protein
LEILKDIHENPAGNKSYGPFKDPQDSVLIHIHSNGIVCNLDFVSPAVFIDDDGQAYLYMGQLVVNAIKGTIQEVVPTKKCCKKN